MDASDRQAVMAICGGLALATLALLLLTTVLKFKFVVGVGD